MRFWHKVILIDTENVLSIDYDECDEEAIIRHVRTDTRLGKYSGFEEEVQDFVEWLHDEIGTEALRKLGPATKEAIDFAIKPSMRWRWRPAP